LLKGAAEFWAARLITTTVTDPATGGSREVLVDDHDWSPEHGPQDGIGNTYSQELVWMLFGHWRRPPNCSTSTGTTERNCLT
jgi:alpha-L-fucosidase 2